MAPPTPIPSSSSAKPEPAKAPALIQPSEFSSWPSTSKWASSSAAPAENLSMKPSSMTTTTVTTTTNAMPASLPVPPLPSLAAASAEAFSVAAKHASAAAASAAAAGRERPCPTTLQAPPQYNDDPELGLGLGLGLNLQGGPFAPNFQSGPTAEMYYTGSFSSSGSSSFSSSSFGSSSSSSSSSRNPRRCNSDSGIRNSLLSRVVEGFLQRTHGPADADGAAGPDYFLPEFLDESEASTATTATTTATATAAAAAAGAALPPHPSSWASGYVGGNSSSNNNNNNSNINRINSEYRSRSNGSSDEGGSATAADSSAIAAAAGAGTGREEMVLTVDIDSDGPHWPGSAGTEAPAVQPEPSMMPQSSTPYYYQYQPRPHWWYDGRGIDPSSGEPAMYRSMNNVVAMPSFASFSAMASSSIGPSGTMHAATTVSQSPIPSPRFYRNHEDGADWEQIVQSRVVRAEDSGKAVVGFVLSMSIGTVTWIGAFLLGWQSYAIADPLGRDESWKQAWELWGVVLTFLTAVMEVSVVGILFTISSRAASGRREKHLAFVRFTCTLQFALQAVWTVITVGTMMAEVQQVAVLHVAILTSMLASSLLVMAFWFTVRLDPPAPKLMQTHPQRVFGTLKKYERAFSPSCTICLENFRQRDRVVVLPCQHILHGECSQKWLSQGKGCPYRCSSPEPSETMPGSP